jgi:pimeloyl-ACP methyl ester carboxylesterase
MSSKLNGKTVVLVHGAFADGSSWARVIPLLEAKGLKVVAVQNPLSSLEDDVAATRNAIDQQSGPVILVGHSWAGVVITQAGVHEKVESLVYVTALAPDQGQSVVDLLAGNVPAWADSLEKDAGGFVKLAANTVGKYLAHDLPDSEVRIIAATQGPWKWECTSQKVAEAAWRSKPSWSVVAEQDQLIPGEFQEQMAKNIGAQIVKVPSSHVVILSHPEKVAETIIAAAEAAR